ncbi:MAG: cellulose biosynthesis cyclic di-GMP-binding regulatory protein BcsB [Leptothrix sp. (in: b-proteobacteria)]
MFLFRCLSTRPAPVAWPRAASGLLAALSVCGALLLQPPAHANPATRTQRLTLRELGARQPIDLRGSDASATLTLPVRLDETIVRARLTLVHTFSTTLAPERSQLRVLVNDEVQAVVPVISAQKGQLGSPQTTEVEIDPRYLTEFARLRLQFIGQDPADASGCADPSHSGLWAQVSALSTLELVTRRLALRNDLALLPAPLFDARDSSALRLPVVLAEAASPTTLRSAGVLASWFGALAGGRGARFPVSTQLNAGHALVLATNTERPAGLDLPRVELPTLQMVDHPHDPGAKLLLVLGRDAAQLQTAAEALALGQATLSGERAQVTQYQRCL